MATVLTGQTRADQVNQAGLVISMEESAVRLENGTYVLNYMTQMFGGGIKSVGRTKHEWRERSIIPEVATVTSAASVGDTTIAVDHPEYFHRDEAVAIPSTGEVVLMNEDAGGGTATGKITVVRNTGSGGLVNAIAAGAVVVRLHEAHAEGEAIPPALNITEDEKYTYVQQSDVVSGVTDIMSYERTYGESELAKRRVDAMIEWHRAIDRILWFGVRTREVTSASGPRRHIMQGVREYLTERQVDASGLSGATLTDIGQWLRPTTLFGAASEEKVLLAGQNLWTYLSQYPAAFMQAQPGKDQTWGTTVNRVITPYGTVLVKYNKLFSAEYGQATESVILDPKFIERIQLDGAPMQLKMNVQDNTDIHNIKDVITGTFGLVLKCTAMHRWITGLK